MQIYNKKQELADWIRRRLGAPILQAVPIAPEQLDDIIDEAVLYGGEFMGGIGNSEQIAVVWAKPHEQIIREDLTINHDDRLIKNKDYKHNPTSEHNVPGKGIIITYKQEYQLPRSVLALADIMGGGGGGPYGGDAEGCPEGQDDQSLLDVSAYQAAFGNFGLGGIGGLGGGMGTATTTGLFVPGGTPGFDSFGTRGGQRGQGGGVDLISYYESLQYLEEIRQMMTVKVRTQFLHQERKVRFSPPPPSFGFMIFGVWARVGEEWMYENMWVRRYATALAKKQIAYNGKLYAGAKFPGGVTFDWDFYLTEAKEEITQLMEQLKDGSFSEPPNWFMG